MHQFDLENGSIAERNIVIIAKNIVLRYVINLELQCKLTEYVVNENNPPQIEMIID